MKQIYNDYDKVAFEIHNWQKDLFFRALKEKNNIVMGYFSLADVIGHLSFGKKTKMRVIYMELDEIAQKAMKYADKMLIISDHGMQPIGRFGDHAKYGFWSFSEETEWINPRITEFKGLIKNWR